MKKQKICIIVILILIVMITALVIYKKKNRKEPEPTPIDPGPVVIKSDGTFDFNIIKQVNGTTKENYMISPLSMAYALTLLKEGADGNTLKEVENLLGDYKLSKTINIKNRISMANLLFVKDIYKKDIDENYIKTLQTKYDSDLMFDKFESPKKVNDWISDKTFKMIPNAINQITPDFVLGLANAIAIDVEWENKFDCNRTNKGDFNLSDNTKMETAFMNGSNDVTYLENDKAKGIIKDYASYDMTTGEITYEKTDNVLELEYIAILPNTDVQSYINNLSLKDLDDLIKTGKTSSSKLDINYSLPKYNYDYEYTDFAKGLMNLGMIDAFGGNANFSKMINKNSDLRIFVSQAIHKSHIEISENGTKAAAVTIFMFDKATAMEEEKQKISIIFDKPFVYIIKEKNTNNIWFFGTVYTPIKWEDNKCEQKYE